MVGRSALHARVVACAVMTGRRSMGERSYVHAWRHARDLHVRNVRSGDVEPWVLLVCQGCGRSYRTPRTRDMRAELPDGVCTPHAARLSA